MASTSVYADPNIRSVAIRNQQTLLRMLQEAMHQGVSVMAVVTFLEVARQEGQTLNEIARALSLPDSTASRQLLDLSVQNRKREPGYELVEAKTDPADLRIKRFFLTPKGRTLLEKALRHVEENLIKRRASLPKE